MEFQNKMEGLTPGQSRGTSAPKLPKPERERIRFLLKMLKKISQEAATELAFRKALQISLSLNEIVKEHQLTGISPLTSALEATLNTLTQEETPKNWPKLSASLELLDSFAQNPSEFDSNLLPEAIAEMSRSHSEGGRGVPNTSSEELLQQIRDLKEILKQASVDGSFHKKRLYSCLSSLTGAAHSLELPTAETVFRSLEVALTKYADAGKAPASLLARATEAVELLAREATALREEKPGLPSWKAVNVVERLESSIEELERVPQEATSSVTLPGSVSDLHKESAPRADLSRWVRASERLRQSWERSPDSELKNEVEQFLSIHLANLHSLQSTGERSD